MTITQLEYVVAVDRHRHFAKAASSCHVTQPTLSMQLQKLEEELGIIIFDRSKMPIIPTLEGAPIILQAKVTLREHAKIYHLLDELRGEIQGQLRLAIIPTLSPYILPLFLDSFSKQYPKVELQIYEQKTEHIIKNLEEDNLDAAILVTPLQNRSLIERVLCYEKFLLFINPHHPLASKKKIKESDLDLHDLWLLNEGHCFRDQALKICGTTNRSVLKDNILFESGSLETLKNLVSKTSGYTLLPEMATLGLSSNEISCLREFSGNAPVREVSLVYARSFYKEKLINALEEKIIQNLPKQISSLKRNIEIVPIQ